MKYRVDFNKLCLSEYEFYNRQDSDGFYTFIYLKSEHHNKLKNIIFKENETKLFNFKLIFNINIVKDDNVYVMADYETKPIECAITLKNKQINLQIQPFNIYFNPEWDIEQEGNFGYEINNDFLNHKLNHHLTEINCTSKTIENILMDDIFVDLVED